MLGRLRALERGQGAKKVGDEVILVARFGVYFGYGVLRNSNLRSVVFFFAFAGQQDYEN